MCKERNQVFGVCYLVRARAVAQMARVNFVCVTVIICLHSNRRCMIIVQLYTVDCSVYCCKQHRSLHRPLYSVKTIDIDHIVCRRSRSVAIFKVLEKCTKNLIGHSRLAFNSLESTGDNGRQPPLLPPRPRATRVDTRIHNYRLSAAP